MDNELLQIFLEIQQENLNELNRKKKWHVDMMKAKQETGEDTDYGHLLYIERLQVKIYATEYGMKMMKKAIIIASEHQE